MQVWIKNRHAALKAGQLWWKPHAGHHLESWVCEDKGVKADFYGSMIPSPDGMRIEQVRISIHPCLRGYLVL